MRENLADIETWLSQNKPVAVATVVQTWGSSPRREGAKMAVTPDGGISGSVSGGCVEAAVFEEAVEALSSHRPRLLHYGVADETAWEVGLACGGSIDIFVKPLDRSLLKDLHTVLAGEEPAARRARVRQSPGLPRPPSPRLRLSSASEEPLEPLGKV